jgi:hypothetical protein
VDKDKTTYGNMETMEESEDEDKEPPKIRDKTGA